ncbi:hypothetical protein M5D96_012814, partial [Drosophila gunungcola]
MQFYLLSVHGQVLSAIACCCLFATCGGEEIEAVSSKVADKVEAVATTKLTPSIEEDAKSKTEKRDSSDQTGTPYFGLSSKEPPFRPIYPPSSRFESEPPTQIFGPTTLRYTAAEAAPPQAFHGQKGPQHHRFSFAVPPQVEPFQRQAAYKPVATPPQPQPQPQPQAQAIFNYGELEPAAPLGHLGRLGHLHHSQGQQGGKYLQQPPQKLQQRIQYIIAIPLSYMRQLQQQQQLQQQHQQQQHQLLLAPLPTGSSSSSSSSTSSTAPPSPSPSSPPHPTPTGRHPLGQLLGPLARDHQGQYRPYYQSDAVSAPLAGPTAPLIHQPYLQIPTSLLMAAAQQLHQHHHHHQQQQQQQQQQQVMYAKVAAPAPPPTYQPAQLFYQPAPPSSPAHHHPQQPQIQLQLQRIFLQPPQPQQSTIYAEQPGPLYVLSQQQQQQQQQHQFAILPRFSNNNPKAVYNMAHESAGPLHVVRLSAANGPPIHHYHHYQPASVLQPLYSHAPQQYVSPYEEGPKSLASVSGSGSDSVSASPS